MDYYHPTAHAALSSDQYYPDTPLTMDESETSQDSVLSSCEKLKRPADSNESKNSSLESENCSQSTSGSLSNSSNGSDENKNKALTPPGSPRFQDEKFKHLQKVRAHIQKKTFTKWCNSYLHKRSLKIEDLYTDLADGTKLWQLLEILCGESLGKPNSGKLRVQKLENVNVCLSYINTKVHLENIGAEDIVDGNSRLILGLIWTIILRFQIEDISIDLTQEESQRWSATRKEALGDETDEATKSRIKANIFDAKATSKNALLVWCKRRTQEYKNVQIDNFSSSWKNGLAFLALLHSYRPDLVDFETYESWNSVENLRTAFEIAETYLGIYRLLDPEDVESDPDEKSILTYISCLYHFFHNPKLLGKMSPTKLFKFKKSASHVAENSQASTTVGTSSSKETSRSVSIHNAPLARTESMQDDESDVQKTHLKSNTTPSIGTGSTFAKKLLKVGNHQSNQSDNQTTTNTKNNKNYLESQINIQNTNKKINNKKIMSGEGINNKGGDVKLINENLVSPTEKNLNKTSSNNTNNNDNKNETGKKVDNVKTPDPTISTTTTNSTVDRKESDSPSLLQQIKQKLTGGTPSINNNPTTESSENLIEPTSVGQLTSGYSADSSGKPSLTQSRDYLEQDYYHKSPGDSNKPNNKDMASSTIIKKTITTTRTSGGGGGGGGYYASGGSAAGGGAGWAGGFGDMASPKATIAFREKEKKELQELNERFASYIERVRRLEKQHGELIEEIVAIKNELIRIVSSVRMQFENELREARRELDDTSRDKARLEVRCNRIEDDIDEYRQKYDDISRLHHSERDKLLRLEVLLSEKDGELANLQKKLDQANEDIERYRRELERLLDELANAKVTNEDELLIRVDLENKLQSLQEDLDFQQQLHQATLKELMEGIRRDDSGEFRRIFQNELSLAIKDIRTEYENISKMMYPNNEEWYKMKIQEFMELTQKKNVEEQSAKDDAKRSRSRVTEISTEIMELRSANASLEKRIMELERAINNESSDFEAQLAQRDYEMQELQEKIAAQLFELRELMDTKLRLDLEIAAYRRLLEGEENRLNLTPESIKHVRKAISQIGTREVYGGDSLSRALPSETSSKTSYQRTSKGPLTITEVDPDGKYISLENTSKLKEQPIEGWQIRRNIDNRDNIIYTFPPKFVIPPGKTIRIFASNYYDGKPDSLKFDERRSWGTGNNVTTVLYTDKGEEKAAHVQKTISH